MAMLSKRQLKITEHIESSVGLNKIYKFHSGKQCLTHFLTISFNFHFLIFTCPFRIARIENIEKDHKAKFVVKSWWPQKFVCFIVTILGYAFSTHFIRSRLPHGEVKNPKTHLDLINQIIYVLLCATTTTTFWKTPQHFVDIASFISSEDFQLGRQLCPSFFRSKLMIFLVCFVYVANCLAGITFEMPRRADNSLDLNRWWGNVVVAGRSFFFLSEDNSFAAQWETILGVIGCAGAIQG